MLLAASDMDLLVGFFVVVISIGLLVLQILWMLRVMRALESTARSNEAGAAQLDQLRNAIVVVGRHITGEPEPPKPRRAPNL